MAERARDSSWLLSDEARPVVTVPRREVQVVREFRLPTCIGKPPSYGIADGTPRPDLVPEGRFRDRTLAWFSLGEEQASEECAEFDVVAARSGRHRLLAIALGAVGLLGIAVTLGALL